MVFVRRKNIASAPNDKMEVLQQYEEGKNSKL
jgi:hypothetical protein